MWEAWIKREIGGAYVDVGGGVLDLLRIKLELPVGKTDWTFCQVFTKLGWITNLVKFRNNLKPRYSLDYIHYILAINREWEGRGDHQPEQPRILVTTAFPPLSSTRTRRGVPHTRVRRVR